jgi:hypothetical protein
MTVLEYLQSNPLAQLVKEAPAEEGEDYDKCGVLSANVELIPATHGGLNQFIEHLANLELRYIRDSDNLLTIYRRRAVTNLVELTREEAVKLRPDLAHDSAPADAKYYLVCCEEQSPEAGPVPLHNVAIGSAYVLAAAPSGYRMRYMTTRNESIEVLHQRLEAAQKTLPKLSWSNARNVVTVSRLGNALLIPVEGIQHRCVQGVHQYHIKLTSKYGPYHVY